MESSYPSQHRGPCACSGFERPVSPSRRDFLSQFWRVASAASPLPRSFHATERLHRRRGRFRQDAITRHAPAASFRYFFPADLSHVDSLDYKPELHRSHGKVLQGDQPEAFFKNVGLLHQSHFPFKQYGQSGQWISEMFPRLGEVVDELTFIRSMVAESGNHIPAIYQANSGFRNIGFPSLGSWLSYGLGSLADSLPTFIVMPDPRGLYAGGTNYWASGFLPAQHQGVTLHASGTIVNDLKSATPVDAKD